MDLIINILLGSLLGAAIFVPIQIALWNWEYKRYRRNLYKKYPWLNPNRNDTQSQ